MEKPVFKTDKQREDYENELEKFRVQSYMIENLNQNNEELAINLGVKPKIIAGNYVALLTKNKINDKRERLVDSLDINDFIGKYVKYFKEVSDEIIDEIIEPIVEFITPIKKRVVGEFTNYDGEYKKIARELIENSILSVPYGGKVILTLSGTQCIIEMNLFSLNNTFNFDSAENNNESYYQMLDTIRQNELPISAYRGDVLDIIKNSSENRYSHLILDFCGQFSTIEPHIISAMERNIMEVNGIMAISTNKRCKVTDRVDFYNDIDPLVDYDEMTRCEKALNTLILVKGGGRYIIKQRFNYKEKRKSAMVLFIVQRIS